MFIYAAYNYIIRYTIYNDLGTCCNHDGILMIHHLSSFTYSAMKLLEHDIHPRCAMRSACGNSVMARYTRKNGNFSLNTKEKIVSPVADFCEQFRSAEDVPRKFLATRFVGDGIFDFAHLPHTFANTNWPPRHTAPLHITKLACDATNARPLHFLSLIL